MIYLNTKNSQAGCGCLAVGLLVTFLLFKAFWKPLLLLFLLAYLGFQLRSLFGKRQSDDKPSSSAETVSGTTYTRPRKDAEVIDDDN